MNDKALELDGIAQRYGVLPSTVARLPYDDFMLCRSVAVAGVRAEREANRKALEAARHGSRGR